MFNIEFPEALKKPLDLLYSNVRGARGKKAEEIGFDAYTPALYLLLSPVCCSAPSLPSLLAARPPLARCPRQTRQLRLDRPDSSD